MAVHADKYPKMISWGVNPSKGGRFSDKIAAHQKYSRLINIIFYDIRADMARPRNIGFNSFRRTTNSLSYMALIDANASRIQTLEFLKLLELPSAYDLRSLK
jgi:hypothetical protein